MDHPLTFALVQLILTVPVLFTGGRFFRVGFKTLFKARAEHGHAGRHWHGSAFLYGVYATVLIALGQTEFAQHLYFESAAVVITLVMLGKYLEAVVKGKTSKRLKNSSASNPRRRRFCKTALNWKFLSTRSRLAIWCSCAQARLFRWTERLHRALPAWTKACLPAKACRWKNSPVRA
jgi:uncharacterized membrane protein